MGSSEPRTQALQRAAGAYRAALEATGTLTEWPLTGYDTTGVPVVATAWDGPGGPEAGGDAHGVGYGATEVEAQVGALGELAERVALAPRLGGLLRGARRASHAELVAELGAGGVVDPLELVLPAGSPYAADQPLDWVPAVRWRTGEQVLVPADAAAFDTSLPPPGGAGQLFTPVSNGLGAGAGDDALVRAVGHGLLELLQRDGDTVSFKALDTGVVVDVDALAAAEAATGDAELAGVLAQLRAAGTEPVVKLAESDLVPVVFCHGSHEAPGTPPMAVGAVGEAAHPDAALAVRKALLEHASSRARRVFAFGPLADIARLSPDYWALEQRRPVGEQEERALHAAAAWAGLDVAGVRAAVEPAFGRRTRTVGADELQALSVPGGGSGRGELGPAALLELLLERLDAAGGPDVLVVASAEADGAAGGVRSAKVVVPGLEVETLSYGRIGERVARRLLERGDGPGADLLARSAGPGRAPVRLTPQATERLGGPLWWDAARAAEVLGPLYPLYREPRRHAPQRLGLA
ncbi:YcaO-like family protein [Quadrisphaera sp. KR29]|uniref:YcaO-like family protein n=1 Tax=Quadrisphaera sp. KR29 TaxID=3461391 RepID=UPI004044FC34